jgi:subtilisin family serine protease
MVAGVLFARRGSNAPAICPNCSSLIRPIFAESRSPSASPEELGEAIIETVNAGARVINLSSGISGRRSSGDEKLNQALSFAARHGTIVVAAAGNQSSVRGSCITQHPWVIPVVSCDRRGFISGESNLSSSIGRQGLAAPGQNVVSLGPGNTLAAFSGTSAACAFVTGAVALLWSEHLSLDAGQIKSAITGGANRGSVAPPLMNAWAAWQRLQTSVTKRRVA